MEEDFIGPEGQKIIVLTDRAVSFCVQACNYYVKVSEESVKLTGRRVKASMLTCFSLWRTGYMALIPVICYLLSLSEMRWTATQCWHFIVLKAHNRPQ